MKSMVAYNGREIPKEDKVFAASGKALDAVEKHFVADVDTFADAYPTPAVHGCTPGFYGRKENEFVKEKPPKETDGVGWWRRQNL